MDRKKKIAKIADQPTKVTSVGNLETRWTTLHHDYCVVQLDGILTETGNLEMLKIIPISGDGPQFVARWDQADEHVDIDMHNASRTARKKFKAGVDGYAGHHTSRSTDPKVRVFDVLIRIRSEMVFQGCVSFNVTYGAIVKMESSSNVAAELTVIRARG